MPYIVGYDFDAGGAPGYGFLSDQSPSQSIPHYPGGPNDGIYAPFMYQHPNGNSQSYLADPFLYTAQAPPEDMYAPRQMMATPAAHYPQQLRELNPNNADVYEDHDNQSRKKSRPEKIRTAKPLSLNDLEHDDSRFAKVVRAFFAIEDEKERTVPEIAKAVDRLNPGRYPDFESVKVRSCLGSCSKIYIDLLSCSGW